MNRLPKWIKEYDNLTLAVAWILDKPIYEANKIDLMSKYEITSRYINTRNEKHITLNYLAELKKDTERY
jgi:hypothetical protein